MKEYLENRIKELKKQFEIDKEKYINIPAERTATNRYYYAKLQAIESSIKELEKVLEMIK